MRDTKYRGLTKNVFLDKLRTDGKGTCRWVYGYYCKVEDKHYIILESAQLKCTGRGRFIQPPLPADAIIGFVEVDPETVGQYIGISDKKGVEIYADHIIESFNPIKLERGEQSDYTGLVKWSTKSLAWVLVNKNGEFIEMLCRAEQPEVISNIHENPELLEETKSSE